MNVLDEVTLECLAIMGDRKLKCTDIIDTLSDLVIHGGVLEHFRSSNGAQFMTKASASLSGRTICSATNHQPPKSCPPPATALEVSQCQSASLLARAPKPSMHEHSTRTIQRELITKV